MITLLIFLILEILQRAAVILGVIYILDYAHNGKIDLYMPKMKQLNKKGFMYRFMMKLANKLESARAQRRRAWDFRAREEVEKHGD